MAGLEIWFLTNHEVSQWLSIPVTKHGITWTQSSCNVSLSIASSDTWRQYPGD